MAENQRLKDVQWAPGDERGNAPTWERVGIAVLLDIRDRLDKTNELLSVLQCGNFLRIPSELRQIRLNTKRPAKKKAK